MERKGNCSSENVLYYARILFVWVCLLGQVGHVVAKRLKVEVETPGTLPELVGKEAKYKVTDLTLKGTLNGRDLCFLREMAGRDKERQSTLGRLRVLDMRYVSFARGGGGYVRHGEWREVQGEHTLPPYLFSECGLTHIDLPERLDTIAEGALGATRISRIVLPENVFVGASAFYGSNELAEVVFPRQVRGVWKGAFEGCAQLKTLSLNHVDFISGGAFQKMPAVERIEVNGDVGQLDGWRTFAECPQLKRVDFRGVVLGTGGPTLLADCPRLEQVVFHGDILSTGLGAAEHCPLFEGYTVKGKVLRSQHKDFVPQVSDEERLEGRGLADFMSRFAPVVRRIWAHGGGVMGYMKKTSAPWFYRSACAWASEGRDEEALAHLDIAIKLGFAKYDLIKGGKEWDALRENPEFQALVEKVREVGDYLYVLKKSPAIGKMPVRCLHLRTNRPRTVIWYVCVAISIWTA
ncbi:leucine-rich repeat domain-containing protein [Paraprevotella clara]|uniref:leucine-rich repeat domain-containing protein n=1 Tax=Paraprevotella clara TaxID=454154 RepID=UPI00242CFBB0|nr:leucine-rich repeat domain-containing protein [Paraprevotella clara]